MSNFPNDIFFKNINSEKTIVAEFTRMHADFNTTWGEGGTDDI